MRDPVLRPIAVFLALVLSFTLLLAACSKSNTEETSTTETETVSDVEKFDEEDLENEDEEDLEEVTTSKDKPKTRKQESTTEKTVTVEGADDIEWDGTTRVITMPAYD